MEREPRDHRLEEFVAAEVRIAPEADVACLRPHLLGHGRGAALLAIDVELERRAGFHCRQVHALAELERHAGRRVPGTGLDAGEELAALDREAERVVHGARPGAENLRDAARWKAARLEPQ